ncbi:MAG: NAD-dependent protein deacylase [Verrucomicrobia bacterium]|nr:NAD-dependent protein deacylase [Verrucomicrobiota bacterium]
MALNISGTVVTALKRANRVVVITGAGISAESGIPTFRGVGGLWRTFKAEDLATPQAFARDPKLVWEWYDWRRGLCAKAEPNAAHRVVAAMERFYHQFTLVTQNVDGLHGRAGSRRMVEVHGSVWRGRCMSCGAEVALEQTPLAQLPPKHDGCGGVLRPAVVWFGENYERAVLEQTFTAAEQAQLVLVVGTSGGVSLPVDLVVQARQAGATVIEINTERSAVSRVAHERLEGKAGEILPELWRRAQLSYLADEIETRARRREGRLMVGIAGPPGAGKSALAEALVAEFRNEVVYVPMDGFHFNNARLEALGLRARKGAPETFDRLAFEMAVGELRKAAGPVKLPVYLRELHEPVPEALTVEVETPIVIVEGNYLFLWPEVQGKLDLCIYLDCDAALAREDLIARHQSGGLNALAAERKYEANDRLNRETVEATRGAAQITVRRDAAGWTVVRAAGTAGATGPLRTAAEGDMMPVP